MEAVNIYADKPEGRLDVARDLGSSAYEMFIYDLEPGRSSSPYHYEYSEEWLLVVDGTVVLRAPDGEHTLQRGDLVRFPAGPDGAHKVMNQSDSPARTLLFSGAQVPAVSVYPDSDKIGVFTEGRRDNVMVRRESNVDYWDGEL